MTWAQLDVEGRRLKIPDAMVMVQGGQIVARASAEYDLSDVPPEYDQFLLDHLKTFEVGLPTWAEMERSQIVMANYERRTDAYEQLSWWRRLWTTRPRVSDPINAPEVTPS